MRSTSRIVVALAVAGIALVPASALGLSKGKIVVADEQAFGGSCPFCGGVIAANADTGKESKLSANDQAVNSSHQLFYDPRGVVVDSKGKVLVADQNAFSGLDGGVIKVNPDTGKESKLSSNDQAINASHQYFVGPEGIALDKKGKILIVDRQAFGTGGVIKVDPKTGKESKVSANNQAVNSSHQLFAAPEAIAVDKKGKILVADSFAFGGTGGVIKVNPDTGKESKVSANNQAVNSSSQLFDTPVGITVDKKGKILVADANAFGGTGGVIKVNPDTGKESKLSANNQAVNASSQDFAEPIGIALGPNDKILVSDGAAFGGTGGVIRVNRDTGKQSKLSANNQAVNSSHQLFTYPQGLAVVP